MKLLLIIFLACLFAVSTSVRAQEPVMIDSFGRLNSEEFEARLDSAIIEASEHPDAKIQLLIYRGEKESLGSPYRFFGKVQAYLNHHKRPLATFIPTFCDSQPEQTIELWRLDSDEIKSCSKEEVKITNTTKFDTAYYAKNILGTCCVSDEFGPQQADASLKAFAELLKQYPDAKTYLFVYGGTNVYWTTDSKDREKTVRTIDKKRDVEKFVQKARVILVDAGVESTRINAVNAGYKDSVGSVDMWIVPAGGEIPKPSANYFPKR